jgi:hypothetical protein
MMTPVHSKEASGIVQKRCHLLIQAVVSLNCPVQGKLSKSEHKTLKLRTAPNNVWSPTHELMLVFFSTGTPEIWLQFLKSVEKVFQGQNLTTGPDSCRLLRRVLVATFEAAAANHGNATIEHLENV